MQLMYKLLLLSEAHNLPNNAEYVYLVLSEAHNLPNNAAYV